MKERIEKMLVEVESAIHSTKNESELQEVKGSILGKQGSLTELLK